MTRLEIATLACKILALWLFAQAVILGVRVGPTLVSAVLSVFGPRGFQDAPLWMVVWGGFPVLGYLAMGLFLWFRAAGLARRMVTDDPAPATRADITEEGVMAVAFAAVGVFVLASVFPGIAWSLYQRSAARDSVGVYRPGGEWQPALCSHAIGLGLGLWLLLGSRGIAKVVRWARRAGHKPDQPA